MVKDGGEPLNNDHLALGRYFGVPVHVSAGCSIGQQVTRDEMHDRRDCAFTILAVLLAVCLAFVPAWPSIAASAEQSDQRVPGQWALDSVTLRLAFPEADRFGGLEGEPPAVPAYKGGELAGYVFSTRQVVQSTGYSAKPLDIAVGLGLDGIVTGAVIVEQHEPVLVIGVSEADLSDFVEQYRGMDIREPFRVKRWAGRSENSVDAVSGATISSVVMNDAILRSARGVAASRGLLGSLQSGLDTQSYKPTGWSGLLADDSVQRRTIRVGEAVQAMTDSGGALFAPGVPEPDADESYLEIFLALATPPQIGRNLLGERDYNRLMAELSAGDQVIFVAGQGLYSFKGHRYRKTGEFDRIQLVQGARTFKLKRDDHEGREALKAEGAPDLREIALFILRQKDGFDPLKPWRLQLLVSGQGQDGGQGFAVFDAAYSLPGTLSEGKPHGTGGLPGHAPMA